jgi:L-aminopeptidase/D-esterase-like protein
VATAIGSANSHESKWRWRNADRACPACGKATIIKGKVEFGGGWVCFAKKGGCGAKFRDDDEAITGQVTGRVENPDIADQLNTIDKIAQKRALASAIKGAANVSELFTVDVEDLVEYAVASVPLQIEVQKPANENVIEGTAVVVKKAPLTKEEGQRLADKWMKDKSLTGSDLKKALGGSYDQWADGYDAADKRVSEWYEAQFADPKSE